MEIKDSTTVNDNPQDIFDEMERQNNKLSELSKELLPFIQTIAVKQREYNIAYAEAEMKLKMDGMAITLIRDLAKGNRAVADIGKELYLSEMMYKYTIRRMDDISSRIEQLRSKLTWKRMEMSNAMM